MAQVGPASGSDDAVAGTLHVYLAFDWGEEIDLELARRLVTAEVRDLPRRRRTPASIAYRPSPLRFQLAPVAVDLPGLGPGAPSAEATVFDFAAASVALHLPFRMAAGDLTWLAARLAGPNPAVRAARNAVAPLHARLRPAIRRAEWDESLAEEFYVFQFDPGSLPPAELLRGPHAGWLAGLVRLEGDPLSAEEVAEALRLHVSYTAADLFVADWAAALLIDRDCDETLQTAEFANLQLVEFRYIDRRLDDLLAAAPGMIRSPTRTLFRRDHAQSLRALGELKVDANSLFERTGNALKLVGDQYLARVYRLLSERFHLDEWGAGIERKLEVAEGVYRVLSDQADARRAEFLEVVVIVLIVTELVLAFVRR